MQTIQLQYKGATAQVCTIGGEITSYRTPEGREVIWQADPTVWGSHTPILFPACGILRDNQVKFAGETYPMPKHGFTRRPEFDVVRQGEDFVELAITATDESRKLYPYDFMLHITYTLVEGGFTCAFTVDNQSERVMPFCIGGHPGFICPMEPGAVFEDYQLVFPEAENGTNALAPKGGVVTGFETLALQQGGHVLPLKYDYFDEKDALIFTELKSRSVNLVHRESGRGIHFTFPKEEVLAVWSMPVKHAPYVCLEPWHGMPDTADCSGNFEDKPFATLLQPGMSWQGGFTATIM